MVGFETLPAVLRDAVNKARPNLKNAECKKLTASLDGHEAAIVDVLQRIMRLLDLPPEPEPPRRQIGFHVRPGSETDGGTKGRKR